MKLPNFKHGSLKPPTHIRHETTSPHLYVSPPAIILSLLLLTSGLPSNAQQILQSTARIVDGDSLVLLSDGTRIRLYGIDAPESSQQCNGPSGSYSCGLISKQKLEQKVASNPVSCAVKNEDIFGRSVAICSLVLPQGGQPEDLNAWMVQQGWAVAYREYSKQYVDLEEEAKREGRGIWVGEFDNPAEWRRQQRGGGSGSSSNNNSNSNIGVNASIPSPSSSLNEEGCTIKGNISSNGEKIYHVIGSPSYAATIINESKGERWFCSEDEAVAAGWRKAQSSSRREAPSSSSSSLAVASSSSSSSSNGTSNIIGKKSMHVLGLIIMVVVFNLM